MDGLKEILRTASKEIGIPLGEREIELFHIYYRELLLWNEKMSLVSVKSPLDIPIKHFIDSLTILSYIKADASSLIDIGSGAGFPGIPVKIARNSLAVALIDSSRKKTSFLKNVIRKLNFDGIEVIHDRIEQLKDYVSYRRNFDIVTSRASFKLPRLIEAGAPFLRHGGILIAMKGNNIAEELRASEEVSRQTGIVLSEEYDIRLPISGDPRKILLFKNVTGRQ